LRSFFTQIDQVLDRALILEKRYSNPRCEITANTRIPKTTTPRARAATLASLIDKTVSVTDSSNDGCGGNGPAQKLTSASIKAIAPAIVPMNPGLALPTVILLFPSFVTQLPV